MKKLDREQMNDQLERVEEVRRYAQISTKNQEDTNRLKHSIGLRTGNGKDIGCQAFILSSTLR